MRFNLGDRSGFNTNLNLLPIILMISQSLFELLFFLQYPFAFVEFVMVGLSPRLPLLVSQDISPIIGCVFESKKFAFSFAPFGERSLPFMIYPLISYPRLAKLRISLFRLICAWVAIFLILSHFFPPLSCGSLEFFTRSSKGPILIFSTKVANESSIWMKRFN